MHLKRFARISLRLMLDPVQPWEFENVLLKRWRMFTDVYLSVITTNTTIEEKICLTLIFPGISIIYFECIVYACPDLFQIQNGGCVIRVRKRVLFYTYWKAQISAWYVLGTFLFDFSSEYEDYYDGVPCKAGSINVAGRVCCRYFLSQWRPIFFLIQ